MGFCYHCGHQLERSIPPGDDREREHCLACDNTHYVNPRILVSCIVHSDAKLLWIRRGLDPAKGLWAMPAGFMEQGESLQQATVRELGEETGLVIAADALELSVLSSLTFINQVYVVFRVYHREVTLRPPSAEVQDIAFLKESEVPWQQLAYPETEHYMRSFYREVKAAHFEPYIGEFSRHQQGLKKIVDGEQL